MTICSKKSRIVTQSQKMKHVFELIEKVAKTSSSVLISGESGTGKELVAQAIHDRSLRSEKPFVGINCGAIPSELLESELFGHERGAFTGAHKRHTGKFEFADDGTIFLDEISTLKLELQVKLLRFLQELEFTRVGSHQSVKVDVRIIAATNTNLKDMVRKGEFREDLYYRLYVIPIKLPPLRIRKGDIKYLSAFFLNKYNSLLKKDIKGISSGAMSVLENYSWPGNIRELENLIERLVVLGDDNRLIETDDLGVNIPEEDRFSEETKKHTNKNKGLLPARRAFEREYIIRALRVCSWNQSKAARMLNIRRNTLMKKIRGLNIKKAPTLSD